MADRKISDLTALTTPATGDLIPIVDISEAAAADKNKSITVGELLRGAPDGTAAAPGFAFESDGGNGMFLGGTDILAFSTGGNQAVTIDASQRLGVGTSTPGSYYSGAENLVVANISGNAGITVATATDGTGRFFFADGTSGNDEYRGYLEYSHAADVLQIGANAETAIIIDSGQDVHISPNSTSLERLSILTGGGGGIQLNRNASGAPSSGDELGSIGFKGIESANSNAAAEASIRAVTFENHSGTTAGTDLVFDTKNTAVGPGSAPQPRFRIGGDGILDLYNDAQSVWAQFARQVQFGYGSPYKCLMLGGIETNASNSISLGYNVSGNPSGAAFSGDGREIVLRNNAQFLTPNATDDSWAINQRFNYAGFGTCNFPSGFSFNNDTAAANVLDDYEEGDWTPAVAGGGWTLDAINSAKYVKIGRHVTVQCFITLTGSGTATSLNISGLPFNTPTDGYYVGVADFGYPGKAGIYVRTGSASDTVGYLYSNESTATLRGDLLGNEIGAGYHIFTLTYQV